ncbi:proline rich transmembrane protein 1B-like [Amphiura filiformis]|uniref:proline rich transmembrane protein 1B-like n=1 Tax=Amphiura filiformis TaxID=82378 RepID=UPI003B2215A9
MAGNEVAMSQQSHFAHPSQVNMMRTPQAPPKDYLIMAVLVTIFCCLPFGIVGIIKSNSARTMHVIGNYEEAELASKSANNWTTAGLTFGIIKWTIYVIVIILYTV